MGKMSPFLGGFWGETAPQRGPFSTQIWWIHFAPRYPRLPSLGTNP